MIALPDCCRVAPCKAFPTAGSQSWMIARPGTPTALTSGTGGRTSARNVVACAGTVATLDGEQGVAGA